ncbi:MAG TPA: FAD-dependent oxidoreductase [Acetobacteraceae bacterium]|nr:FAD-dependent oxidoreductase [Acetobacteraceae bacterium]
MPDLIVIGAGLSGRALERAVTGRGAEVVVLEARARIGGRVLSHRTEAGVYDLGPAWVWPSLRPRIARAVRAAVLVLTEPAETGGFIVQDQTGRTQHLPHGFAQEPPRMRMTGGIAALVEAVAASLAPGVAWLEHAVRRIALTATGVAVTAETRSGPMTMHAARAARALPPRLIGGIEIVPTLPPFHAGGACRCAGLDGGAGQGAGLLRPAVLPRGGSVGQRLQPGGTARGTTGREPSRCRRGGVVRLFLLTTRPPRGATHGLAGAGRPPARHAVRRRGGAAARDNHPGLGNRTLHRDRG